MPNVKKVTLKELEVKSFKTAGESKKVVGGYITAAINTCSPCRPGGTNNVQCTLGC